ATRQGVGGAIQRQVVEPDLNEEAEALENRANERQRDRRVAADEVALRGVLVEEGPHAVQRHPAELADVLAADFHGERLRAQSHPVAGLAGLRDREAPEILRADRAVVRLVFSVGELTGFQHLAELRDDASVLALPPSALERRFCRAEEERAAHLLREVAEGDVGIDAERFYRPCDFGGGRDRAAPTERGDRTLPQ